ncbi:hypothetical protein DH2020_037492 [Rehmannia glutinosa]|uniref:Uncharacterized protein n=1 Tax=Rehmannia glutinosa TaxID=99300 RepID=A0ABR0V400_REHGL
MSSPVNLSSTGTSTDPEISRFAAWVDDLELSFENVAPSASHNTKDSSSNLPASSGSISDRSYSNVEIRPAIPTSHVDSAFNATTMFARNLKYLCKNISIPPSFKLALPSSYDRPSRPPPGFLAFFSGQIDGGLGFSIHPLMAELSALYQIPLNQFSPNSFRLMTATTMNKRLAEKETAQKRNVSMSRAPSQGTSFNPQSIQPPFPSITSAQPTEDQTPKSPRTIRPDSSRDVIKELTDSSNNPIPKKCPPSALDSSQKKSKTALLRLSEIVARGRVGFADPELINERNDLKQQVAKLKERDAKMLKILDKGKAELEEHKVALAQKDEEIGALKAVLKKF